MSSKPGWSFALMLAFSLAVPLSGQTQGWRRVDEPAPTNATADPLPPSGTLTLPAGAWITVRVDEMLSSDHNQPGDGFTATLVQPLVADGLVLAARGQTVGGRVVEAVRAGRGKGTSRLGLELTEASLVDGQQMPIRTRLIEYQAGSSTGRDATVIATTTGAGAAIGAVAEGGFGAGVGAVAGLAAGMIGVMATRGRPTEVYPETQLTFRLEAPLIVSTENSAPVFRPVAPGDYEPNLQRRTRVSAPPPPPPYYYGYGYPGYWGHPYFYPYFYGPSFFFYSGPRFYGHRGFHRRW